MPLTVLKGCGFGVTHSLCLMRRCWVIFPLLPSTLYMAALSLLKLLVLFLSLFLFFRILCCLPLQEYIRRQLEEEQRQLEILQQQLLHEQALLLVMGKP